MIPYFWEPLQKFDIAVLNWIQYNIANPFFDVFFKIITSLGNGGVLMILTAVIMVCFKKTRKVGITLGACLFIGLILCNCVLKNVVARVRPFDLDGAYGSIKEAADLLISRPGDKSFPSGHALAAFEISFVMLWWKKKIGIPVLVICTLIAFSRLYLYVHFPSDVLFSVLLAAFNTFLAVKIVDWVYKKYVDPKTLK